MAEIKMTRRRFIKHSVAGALATAPLSLVGGCAARLDLKEEMDRLDQNPATRSKNASYIDAYDFDGCIECGECLHGCIYKNLTEDEAIANIKKMREGDVKVCEDMLDQCVLCYNCDYRCPVGARPSALMLERLRDRRNREGDVPESLKYAINGMESKGWHRNLFRDLYTDHSREEEKILEAWAEPKDCGDGDLLWCSCASRIFPYDIEHSQALSGLQKFGGRSDCCGLAAFRSGLFDVARFLTNNLIERLSQCRFKRLVVLCGSCQDMFQFALPEYYGQEFPFEVISAYQYLDEQIQQGKLSIQRQVPAEESKNSCVCHSCFGYKFGKDYLATIKRLHEAVGYEWAELEHSGENNACCGMGGFYREGNLGGIRDAKKIRKKDIKTSEKENFVAYCYGCYITTQLPFLSSGGTSHFLMEKLLWALGDEIRYPLGGILGRSMNFSSFVHMWTIGPSALF